METTVSPGGGAPTLQRVAGTKAQARGAVAASSPVQKAFALTDQELPDRTAQAGAKTSTGRDRAPSSSASRATRVPSGAKAATGEPAEGQLARLVRGELAHRER